MSSIKREIEIAKRHAPRVAVPTLLLLAGICAALALSTALALGEYLPLWLGGLINGVILYGTYTIVHEGVHGNIVSRVPRLAWLNLAAASLAAVPLWLLVYPHRASHFVHHRKCNTDADPDIYARGNFGVVTFWRIPRAILGQFDPFEQYRHCRDLGLNRTQRLVTGATFVAYVALVAALITLGYGYELLVLWFIPFFVGYGVMLVLFTWVPHHPHTITGRYHDTRCSLWPGANLLTQGQNFHLIHHMLPWVPWYRYRSVFDEIRPALEAEHAIIDGFWPRPAEDAVAWIADRRCGRK